MSSSQTDTTSHIRRRRYASQTAPNPNWVRRAGIAGGVIGTIALTGMSAPAKADTATATSDPTATGSIPVIPLSTATTAAQAVDALDRAALDIQVQAEKDDAYQAALKQAEKAKQAADRKAAAAKATAKARDTAAASRSSARTSLSSPASGSIATVISFLKSQVGKPYVYGASGPNAYDCSSLTKTAFATIGVDLPRTAAQQSTVGTAVSVSDVQVGDLLFWGGRGSAYHVAVYVGDGQYLDAANPSKGVVIQKMAYYMPTSAVRVA